MNADRPPVGICLINSVSCPQRVRKASHQAAKRCRAVEQNLARCKDMASRAREMAKYALSQEVKRTLLEVAADYDRLVTEIEAEQAAPES